MIQEIDLSKGEWMRVSHSKISCEGEGIKRFVVARTPEFFIAVANAEEEKELLDTYITNGIAITTWKYASPIPEKKMRPWTILELLQEDRKNGPILIKPYDEIKFKSVSSYAFSEDFDFTGWQAKYPDGTIKKCEREE